MKLYEITGAMKEVQKMLDEGVPLEQLEDTLNEIDIDFNEKAGGCLFAISNLNGEIASCKHELERLSRIKKQKESQILKIKEYLLLNMQELGKTKVANGTMVASVRKGAKALQINNEDNIPIEYKSILTTSAVDKKALLKALKDLEEGEVIAGAEIVAGKNTLIIK